jgi:hypothetical protein
MNLAQIGVGSTRFAHPANFQIPFLDLGRFNELNWGTVQPVAPWADYATFFVGLLSIVNPIGSTPIFLNLTMNESPDERNRTGLITALSFWIVLIIALLAGEAVLRFLGITVSSFRSGGRYPTFDGDLHDTCPYESGKAHGGGGPGRGGEKFRSRCPVGDSASRRTGRDQYRDRLCPQVFFFMPLFIPRHRELRSGLYRLDLFTLGTPDFVNSWKNGNEYYYAGLGFNHGRH